MFIFTVTNFILSDIPNTILLSAGGCYRIYSLTYEVNHQVQLLFIFIIFPIDLLNCQKVDYISNQTSICSKSGQFDSIVLNNYYCTLYQILYVCNEMKITCYLISVTYWKSVNALNLRTTLLTII